MNQNLAGLSLLILACGIGVLPGVVSAQVADFVFVSDSQTIVLGAVSGQMTVQAQSSGGTSVNIPQTACFSFDTSSSRGEFSSSATTWNSVTVLTMNKNTANKSFYYKDIQEGAYTLTVKVSLKPEDESRSCANWPVGEWNISWTATQNITVGVASPSSNSDTGVATSTAQNTSTGNSSNDSVMPPPPKVFADGGSDRTVIVGADTEFRARAYDEKKNIIGFSRFHWNFGDGSTSDASTVSHRFEYPGRYVVVLDIPEEKDSVADQIIVTVEPMKLVLSLMPDGGVAIENRAGRTLDLSGWGIHSMGRTFKIPQHTLVLANNPLRISQRTMGFSGGAEVGLLYPDGTFALGIVPVATSTPADSVPVAAPLARSARESSRAGSQTFVPEEESAPVEQPMPLASTSDASLSQAAGAGLIPINSSRMWWMGAIGIAGLAAGSLVVARRFGKKEWDIEEIVETR